MSITATYKELGHTEFWNRIYGEAPAWPTMWDVEDYADENGFTDLDEARAAMIAEKE